MEEENFLEMARLIAARKALFYRMIVSEAAKRHQPINEDKIKKRIADTENEDFMTEEERAAKKLKLNVSWNELDVDVEDFLDMS